MNATPDSPYCGCLFFSANALARLMTSLAEQKFQATGLAPSLAFVVMTVNQQPGIQPKQISAVMELTPSTVTRLVEKLEHQGYVCREATGRITRVHPTDRGLALQPQLQQAWHNVGVRYKEVLGSEAAAELTRQTYAASRALQP